MDNWKDQSVSKVLQRGVSLATVRDSGEKDSKSPVHDEGVSSTQEHSVEGHEEREKRSW